MFTIRKKRNQESADEMQQTDLEMQESMEADTLQEDVEEAGVDEETDRTVDEDGGDNDADSDAEVEDVGVKLRRFAAERGLDEETAAGLENLARRLGEEFASGRLGEESMEMLLRAVTYGREIERTAVEAELRGRNAAIEERLRMLDDSDGLPHPGAGQAGPAGQRMAGSIFDIAREAW